MAIFLYFHSHNKLIICVKLLYLMYLGLVNSESISIHYKLFVPNHKFSLSLPAYYMFSHHLFTTLVTENEIEILQMVEQGKSPL